MLAAPSPLRRPLVVADPEPLTLPDMVAAIRRGLDRRPGLVPVPPPMLAAACRLAGRDEAYRRLAGALVADPAALKQLGWRPSVTTPEGLGVADAMSCADRTQWPVTIRLRKAAIRAETGHVKRSCAIIIAFVTLAEVAVAQTVPLPRPRPFSNKEAPPARTAATSCTGCTDAAAAPSACRVRLTAERAIAPSVDAIEGPGECGGDDLVRLEAVILADSSRVEINPPAVLRCNMADALVDWVRDDLAQLTAFNLGSRVRSVRNYAAYHCRSRNNIIGAMMSEHGKGNAIDVRSITLVNGKTDRPDRRPCVAGFPRGLEEERVRPLLDGARPRFRRLSREPHPRGPDGTPLGLSRDVPVGRAHARGQAGARNSPARQASRCRCRSRARRSTCRPRANSATFRRPIASGMIGSCPASMPSNLATRDIESLVHPYTNLATFRDSGPLIIERGQGIHVYDTAGRGYIDGMAGLWCTALGWGNEELADTAAAQMRKLAFGHLFGGKSHDGAIELAEKLKEIAPVPTSKVFFCNSGSEANDTQIKLVWYMNNALGRPRKKKIISRRKGYHGVTIASASLTGLPVNQTDFDVPIANILHTVVPAPLPLRARGRERGGFRDAAGRRARRTDPAGRAGHGRGILRRAGDGGGRRASFRPRPISTRCWRSAPGTTSTSSATR